MTDGNCALVEDPVMVLAESETVTRIVVMKVRKRHAVRGFDYAGAVCDSAYAADGASVGVGDRTDDDRKQGVAYEVLIFLWLGDPSERNRA